MKIKKKYISNTVFIIFMILLLIPQTRKSIQVAAHSIKTLFAPSIESGEKELLSDYNWTLLNEKGEEFNFEITKNKVVFVNLWATWCAPCIAELPAIEKLYKDYGDKVVFLFVSNEKQDKVSRFLEKRTMEIPHYQPVTAIPELLSTTTIPATFVIGRNGTIHVNERGAANWNSDSVRNLLDTLLAE